MNEYLFEYRFGGEIWGITIHAKDDLEAREKIKAICFAQYKGVVAAKIPAGPVGTAISWLKSLAGGRLASIFRTVRCVALHSWWHWSATPAGMHRYECTCHCCGSTWVSTE